ncbi:MAG TPA: hypothetical protein VGT60_10920 [Candidatus Limnocylindria bacterium]|nr:hypothetical protein [Candidatus Limnocylindria bacterium]
MASASLAGRRWGHAISGWLVGIPFTSGPITLFLYLDHGAAFAANAALGSLVGVLATSAFAVEFSAVAKRTQRMVPSFVAGLIAFALIGGAAQELAIAPLPLYAICAVVLVFAIRLVPDPGATASVALPRWDLPARMILATALVLAITGGATALGPRLAGLLATIPLYASILAGFGFQLIGPAAAIRVWRGLLFGLFGFGAFYLVIAAAAESLGLGAFGLALVTAVGMQSVTLRMLRDERRVGEAR